jgi:hypothetical protein
MIETLLQPADSLFLFVDYQAGLAFGVESIARQAIHFAVRRKHLHGLFVGTAGTQQSARGRVRRGERFIDQKLLAETRHARP